MLLDGKMVADGILQSITHTVSTLQSKGIIPTLGVILVGDDPGSLSYIKQKQKMAERVGIRVIFEHFPDTISPEVLASAIAHYNADPDVHGLIIQRPVPTFIGDTGDILQTVIPSKDVDGFHPQSPFQVPVAKAVVTLLSTAHASLTAEGLIHLDFIPWLQSQSIAVVGRGETAGKPIADLLTTYTCTPTVIHSRTDHPENILKQSSVIISCVGRREVLKKSYISQGAILISVGLWRDTDGKLHGDYERADIEQLAAFYTPTPGGVGPVNVACLMQNVLEACILQRDLHI